MIDVGLVALVLAVSVVFVTGILAFARGRGVGILPAVLFCGCEVVVVWPALVRDQDVIGPGAVLLAAVGLMLAALTYAILSTRGTHDETKSVDVPSATVLNRLKLGLVLLVAFLTAVGVYIFQGIPPLVTGYHALLAPSANQQSVELLRQTRLQLTKGELIGTGASGQGVLNLVETNGWQAAVVLAVLYWSWRRTRESLIGALVVAVLAFVFLGSFGARLPILMTLLAVFLVFTIRFRVRLRQSVAMGLAAVAIALMIVPLSKGIEGQDSLSGRVATLSDRIFSGNGQNNVAIVRLVDSGHLDVRPGSLFVERSAAMLPGVGEEDPFAHRLTRLAYRTDSTGFSTPTQYGLIYADLGPVGVPLGYVLSGALLALAWTRIVRIKHVLRPAFCALFGTYLGYMSVTGVHGVVANAAVATFMMGICYAPVFLSRTPMKQPESTSTDAGTGRAPVPA